MVNLQGDEPFAPAAGIRAVAATLAASIRKGGSGKWGPVPMPAQAALSEADARTLAEWILAGAR